VPRLAAAHRARADQQRTARGEEATYDVGTPAAARAQDVSSRCLLDLDPGDGIPRRRDSNTWSRHLLRKQLVGKPITARLVADLA
jgi:hypothetical protein